MKKTNTKATTTKANSKANTQTTAVKAETKTEKVDVAAKLLEDGVRNVFTNENYVRYLKFQNTFHTYSVNNQALIFMQNPDATYVAGFHTWANKLERKVNKGAKAIKILAPVPHTKTVDTDKEGNPLPEDKRKTVNWTTYRVVNVFDVSQTTGKELPKAEDVCKALKGKVKNYKALIETLVGKVSECPVAFSEIKNGSHGYYMPSKGRIVIKTNMSQSQTVKTLLHEIAHSMMHTKGDETDRKTMEVQAESVAFIVSNMLGIDTSDYSFGYIAGWSGDKDVKALIKSMNEIKKTAYAILDKIAA